MSMELPTRFSLRDLPFPAKLVITCFLLAVGGGYSAAMVQLHMQDSKTGAPMPTVHDVIQKYTGKKFFETDPPKPVCLFEKLVMGPIEGAPWNRTGSMAPAFFAKDGGEFNRLIKGAPSEVIERVKAERNGERDVIQQWIHAAPEERKKAYDEDRFHPDAAQAPKTITNDFKHAEPGSYKVKSILVDRCERCHSKDGAQSAYPLETYEQLLGCLIAPPSVSVPAGGGWVRIEEPISYEKLTQTTHAHLLSFAVLFSLTGLVFAFTSYPAVLRCLLGPWVLVAVVADVSLWWLSRLCEQWGPYFAMGIIGTGGAAGLGLSLQIVLSLFNMYGPKGKVVILGLFLLAGAGAAAVGMNVIKPGLEAKQQRLSTAANGTEPKPEPKKEPEKKETPVAPIAAMKGFEKMLLFPVKGPDGKELAVNELKWKRDQDGGMVRAFFDKDSGEFAAALKAKDLATQAQLTPMRHTEREILLAWNNLPDDERKKAYDLDAFMLPAELAKKPISVDYAAGAKVKIQSLITDRCIRCHEAEEDVMFSNYETMKKYLK